MATQEELENLQGANKIFTFPNPTNKQLDIAFTYICTSLKNPRTRPAALSLGVPSNLHLAFPHFTSSFFLVDAITGIDQVCKELMKSDFYPELIRFVLSNEIIERILSPFCNMFGRSLKLNEFIAEKVPNFLEMLYQCSLNLTGKNKMRVCGVMMDMLGLYATGPKYMNLIKPYMIACLRGENGEAQIYDALAWIQDAASFELSRPILAAAGIPEEIEPYVMNKDPNMSFQACLLQGLLSASEVEPGSKVGPTPLVAVDQVVASLENFVSLDIPYVSTTPGYCATLDVILLALKNIALNESNLKILREKNIIPTLANLLVKRKQLISDSHKHLIAAAQLVWALSFDETSKKLLLEHKIAEKLKAYDMEPGEEAQRAVSGALWNLEGMKKQNDLNLEKRQTQEAQGTLPPSTSGHVMISYSWGQKDRMRQVAAHLKAAGFSIWLDIEQMEGSVLEKMAEAIEGSSIVIIGVSSTYKESQACRTEAEYAYQLKKKVVYVMAEDTYTAKGWLGAMMGNQLRYYPWTDARGFEAGIGDVIKYIRSSTHASPAPSGNSGTAPEAPAPAPVTSSTNSSASIKIRSYTDVKLPENKDPLPKEMLSLAKIKSWKSEEVYRWLLMNDLEDLCAPFIWHKIDGDGLIQLQSVQERHQLWESLAIPESGTFLKFGKRISDLFSKLHNEPASWNTSQVTEWLKAAPLTDIANLCRESYWDGTVIKGLHQISKDPTGFRVYCQDLRISSPVQQLRLLAALNGLFES